VDVKFVTPDLRKLDLFVGEMLVLPIFHGERPPKGVTASVDYRLAGAISQLLIQGDFDGSLGQHRILRPRPRLGFDRLLLLGAGSPSQFNPQIYAALIDRLTALLIESGARRAVVELPGRAQDLIAPELAADILLDRAVDTFLDTWTLIEGAEATRRLSARMRRDKAGGWGVNR
jgi:hypothetical protein